MVGPGPAKEVRGAMTFSKVYSCAVTERVWIAFLGACWGIIGVHVLIGIYSQYRDNMWGRLYLDEATVRAAQAQAPLEAMFGYVCVTLLFIVPAANILYVAMRGREA